MGAQNSAELQALREMCFPHVQQHAEPTVQPPVESSTSRSSGFGSLKRLIAMIDLDIEDDNVLELPPQRILPDPAFHARPAVTAEA